MFSYSRQRERQLTISSREVQEVHEVPNMDDDDAPYLQHTTSGLPAARRRQKRSSTHHTLVESIDHIRESSVDCIVDAYQNRDTRYGALSFASQVWNSSVYKERLCELDHVVTRLEKYAGEMVSVLRKEQSDIWQCIVVFSHINLEFRETTNFAQEIVAKLDTDVKEAIGEKVEEFEYHNNYSLWTDEGQRYEAFLIEHLARVWDTEKCGCRSLLDALKKLKWDQQQMDAVPATEKEELEKLVDSCFQYKDFPESKNFWKHGAFTRAFCIGLKDLRKARDFKALIYIMQRAMKLKQDEDMMRIQRRKEKQRRDTANSEAMRKARCGNYCSPSSCCPGTAQEEFDLVHIDDALQQPFGWTIRMATLAGPHIHKFTGDSDALAVLSEKMSQVIYAVLPKFLHRLQRLATVLTLEIQKVQQMHIQMLTLTGAILVASANFGYHVLLKYLEEDAVTDP